jgi:hypothetical protein
LNLVTFRRPQAELPFISSWRLIQLVVSAFLIAFIGVELLTCPLFVKPIAIFVRITFSLVRFIAIAELKPFAFVVVKLPSRQQRP